MSENAFECVETMSVKEREVIVQQQTVVINHQLNFMFKLRSKIKLKLHFLLEFATQDAY